MNTAEIIAQLPRLSPDELAQVRAKLDELAKPNGSAMPTASHPALGVWEDRADLPQDSVEASKSLRARLVQR